jgi:hypothetical protein
VTRQWAAVGIVTWLSLSSGWDGSPFVLQPNQTAVMGQTPNGSTIFTYTNLSTQNNAGTIEIGSGGQRPTRLSVPALTNQPSFLIQNWAANSLTVANASPATDTPIRIQDVGPGMPGSVPKTIPTDGTTVSLAPLEVASTVAMPRYMELIITNSTGNRTEVAVIGGPPDATGANGYAIEMNSPLGNTGVPSGTIPTPPPAPAQTSPPARPAAPAPSAPSSAATTTMFTSQPFYATTGINTYRFDFYWGSSTVFIANLSADTAGSVQVALIGF